MVRCGPDRNDSSSARSDRAPRHNKLPLSRLSDEIITFPLALFQTVLDTARCQTECYRLTRVLEPVITRGGHQMGRHAVLVTTGFLCSVLIGGRSGLYTLTWPN